MAQAASAAGEGDAQVVDDAITAIAVTYNPGDPDPENGDSFERFAKLTTPAYLWFVRGTHGEEPLSDIIVLHGKEDVPTGYTKIDKDLNQGGPKDGQVYLATKTGDGAPITKLKVVGSEEPAGPGFTRVEKDLERKPKTHKSFLCFYSEGDEDDEAGQDVGFKAGDMIDVLDNVQKWCIAEIREISEEGDKAYVHYRGWSDKWNEWVSLTDKPCRIAKYRTHTRGDTGPKTNTSAYRLEDNNLTEFNQASERLQKLLITSKRNAKDKIFLEKDVESMAINLLNALVDDSSLVPRVVKFFENCVLLCLNSLKNDPEIRVSYVVTLYRIFDGEGKYSRFYNKCGVATDERLNFDGRFAAKPSKKQNDPISVYLIKLINFFGDKGGFDALLSRLSASEEGKVDESLPPCSMKILKMLVKVVEATRQYLSKNFAKEFIPRLKNAVFGRVQTISDDEIKSVDRESISDLIGDMDKLLAHVSAESDQFIEEFNLDLALRFITCPFLEKRIYGVLQIHEILGSVDRRERGGYSSSRGYGHSGYNQKPAARYLTPKIVVKWVEQKRLVALLLGQDSHMELIRRTPRVLAFLSRNNALSEGHLDALWNSCIGKHESVVRVVYDAIAELSGALSANHLDFIFDKMKGIDVSEYNDLTLTFVGNFTSNAMKHSGSRKDDKRLYGLDIFWKLIQDDTPVVARDLVKSMENGLIHQLTQPEVENVKPEFLDRCIKNLKQHTSVCQSLRVLRNLIDSYPPSKHRRSDVTQSELIDNLRKKQKLEKLYYDELIRYREKAKANSRGMKPNEINDKILVGREKHSLQIRQRLMFIEFLLTNSSMTLSKERVATLWDVFVTNSVCFEDRSKFLQYLHTARKNDSEKNHIKIFQDDLSEFLFLHYLCDDRQLDPATMTKDAFECFHLFFRHVNGQRKNLSRPMTRVVEVVKWPLVGMEALWNITAKVENEKVFAVSRDFLISMYIKLDQRGDLDKHPVMKDFVERSVGYIRRFYEALKRDSGNASAQRSIRRLLEVLEHYLISSEKVRKQEFSRPHKLQLNVILKEKNSEQSMVATLQSDNKVGLLRTELAKHFQIEKRLLKLVYRDRVLYPRDWDNVTIQDAQISQTIVCEKMEHGDPDSDPEKTSEEKVGEIYARYLLSNHQEYFDLFFDILNFGGDLGQQVWKLIDSLPRNEKLSRTIRQLETKDRPDWRQLGSGDNVLKLLYSLQIVERLVDPPEDYNGPDTTGWSENFIKKGGLKHLYTVLMSMNEDQLFHDQLPQHCLAILLKLINSFLVGPHAETARSIVLKFVDFQSLVDRLIHLVHRASSVKDNPDEDGEEDEKDGRYYDNYRGYDSMDTEMGPMNRDSMNYGGNNYGSSNNNYGSGSYGNSYGGSSYRNRSYYGRDGRRMSEEGEPPEPTRSNQGDVVENSISLLIFCSKENPKLLEILFMFDKLKDTIVQGLLSNPVAHLRVSLSKGIYQICEDFGNLTESNPRDFFVHELLKCLKQIDTKSSNCTEYFDLIQRLLKSEGRHAVTSEQETSELISNLVDKIRAHPIIETRSSDSDHVLQGLLNLCEALISQHPELKEHVGSSRQSADGTPTLGLVAEVFSNCLFDLPKERNDIPPPKCKSPQSRKAAFNLLAVLSKGCNNNLYELLQLMIPNHLVTHSHGNKPYEWDFLSTHEEKSRTGYVGIKNLGCICYMNAFFQQIYMQPTLRSAILSIPDRAHKKEDEDRKDNVIYQLQYILGYLQESEKQFCSPAGFCHSFKDFDGNPTNVSVQMDANEFLNMLFDRIDTKLKGTEAEKALQVVMGGTLVNQLICKGCPHRSEREEPFYCMSVHIKNKKNIQESLEAFVEGEMLEGDNAYLCGICNKKVDTLKRVCVKKLPSLLCIHLSRFEFDFDTMQKIKVNDRCEFPINLSMKNYTAEGLAELEKESTLSKTQSSASEGKESDGKENGKEELEQHPTSYYNYRLCGVVVHTGSANGGHYYSFIKQRGTGVASVDELNSGMGRWFEFNDTIVREMDPESLGNETFGGEETYNRPMHGQWTNVTHEKRRNAYMLFYERVEQELDEKTSSEKLGFEEAAVVVKAAQKLKKMQDSKPVRVHVPEPIYDAIWEENITYWRDKWVFDEDYFEFCLNVVKEFQIEPNDELPPSGSLEDDLHVMVAQLATRFMFETLARSILKDRHVSDWFKVVKKLFNGSVPACCWLLDAMHSESSWSLSMLLECRSSHIRKWVSNLLCTVLDKVVPLEQQHPDHPLLNKPPRRRRGREDEMKEDDKTPIPLSERFVRGLIDLLGQAYRHCDRFPPYFKVLSHYARIGPKQANDFVRFNLVGVLCDFFLGDQSPQAIANIPTNSKGQRKKLRDAFNRLEWTHFLSLLSATVCSAATKTSSRDGCKPPPTLDPSIKNPPSLSQIDETMLFRRQLLQRLLLEGTNKNRGKYVADIISHWCWENWEFSEKIAAYIFEDLEERDYDEQRPYFRTITALLCLDDSLKIKRVNLYLSSLLGVMKHQKKYYKATEMCIEHLIRIAKTSEDCFNWFHEKGSELKWMIDWLEKYDRGPIYGEDKIQMVKSRSHDDYYSSSVNREYGFDPSKKKSYLKNIISGIELDKVGLDDSDEDISEMTFHVGQKLDVKDNVHKWCKAEVKKVEDDRIYVHYVGWSEKWDEWVQTSSPRIARSGQWTDREDTPKHHVSGNRQRGRANVNRGGNYN